MIMITISLDVLKVSGHRLTLSLFLKRLSIIFLINLYILLFSLILAIFLYERQLNINKFIF